MVNTCEVDGRNIPMGEDGFKDGLREGRIRSLEKSYAAINDRMTGIEDAQKEIITAIGSLKDSRAFAQGGVTTGKALLGAMFLFLSGLGGAVIAIITFFRPAS